MKVTQSPADFSTTRPSLPRLTWRVIAFHTHRWLGLVAGILLCIAGLTGSLVVFQDQMHHWWYIQQFGAVIPTETRAAIPPIIERLKATYPSKNFTLESLGFPEGDQDPYVAWFSDAIHHHLGVLVNPYTGQIMGDYVWEKMWHGILLRLHATLLAGDAGILILGIVALLSVILSVTGIILWPGWRKLSAGFKIKWNGHTKRRNFDIHKVSGIITAVFLALTGFTGFAWNIPQAHVEEAIYAFTFTSKLPEPISRPIANQRPVPLEDLLKRADTIFPNAKTTSIGFPHEPEGVFTVSKRQVGESDSWGSTTIAFDQFSGKVVQVKDGMKPSRAGAILDQFIPLHYGTFAGIYSRILYVFVGLAPTVLMGTGVVMWMHRRRPRLDRQLEDKVMSEIRQ
jgi:uncharacterized iron-regulated membrane protein